MRTTAPAIRNMISRLGASDVHSTTPYGRRSIAIAEFLAGVHRRFVRLKIPSSEPEFKVLRTVGEVSGCGRIESILEVLKTAWDGFWGGPPRCRQRRPTAGRHHVRVLEGVANSQSPLKAVVFKSQQLCSDTVSLDLGPLLHSGVAVLHSNVLADNHAGLFVGVFQKSILNRVRQLLAIRAHKMAPRTSQGLQERAWDTTT